MIFSKLSMSSFYFLFRLSIDENFMPNSSCERITIDYEQHSYSICMSNRRIYIVKRSKSQNGTTTSSSSSTSVYNDANEGANSVTTTTNPASTSSNTVLAWKQQTQPSACCRFCWRRRLDQTADSNGNRHYNWKTPFIYLILLFICQKIHHLWALVQIYASLPASHQAASLYSCRESHSTVASCSVASQPRNHW